MPMIPRRRSDATEDTARTKAPGPPGVRYAQKTALSFGDKSTALSMAGFTSKTADHINAKQKSASQKRVPEAF